LSLKKEAEQDSCESARDCCLKNYSNH